MNFCYEQWEEATTQMRWYERLLRSNMTIFMGLLAAVAGFSWRYSAEVENAWFAAASTLISVMLGVFALLGDHRLRKYYFAHLERTLFFEAKLKINLYTKVERKLGEAPWTLRHSGIYRGAIGIMVAVSIAGSFLQEKESIYAVGAQSAAAASTLPEPTCDQPGQCDSAQAELKPSD